MFGDLISQTPEAVSVVVVTVLPDVGIKSSPIQTNFAQNVNFTLNAPFFKIAQKVSKIVVNFCEKICGLDLSKIAQSGHSE